MATRLHAAVGDTILFNRLVGALVGVLLLVTGFVATPVRADPTYPAFTGLVVDDAHVLTSADAADLDRKLTALQRDTGVQFAVVTVGSLGGDEIENYANALFRRWGIGQKGVDNGLLLILAPNERKLRFEVGRGLEGTMTDLQSKLILHNTMVPKLKAGDPAGALKAGADDAILVLTKDKSALPERLKPANDSIDTQTAFVLAIIFLVFLYLVWRSRGSGFWTGWTAGSVIGSSTGSSWSSSDSSSGGDSFSGGGGGDSGGGGSSDSY